jgi:hypothetical protein
MDKSKGLLLTIIVGSALGLGIFVGINIMKHSNAKQNKEDIQQWKEFVDTYHELAKEVYNDLDYVKEKIDLILKKA